MSKHTPELDKLAKHHVEWQAIGEFFEWLESQGMFVGHKVTYRDKFEFERFEPVMLTIEELLARHFDVDLVKVEQERRAVLEQHRRATA